MGNRSSVECGNGTVLEDGVCKVDSTACGRGTRLNQESCQVNLATYTANSLIPDKNLCTESGTKLDGNVCNVDLDVYSPVSSNEILCTDGGTKLNGNICQVDLDVYTPTSSISDSFCSESAPWSAEHGKCVASSAYTLTSSAPTCGSDGTVLEHATNICKLNRTQICGSGLEFDANGHCAVVDGTCGAGTTLENNVCVVKSTICGAGTFENEEGVCGINSDSCGTGSKFENDQCILDMDHICVGNTKIDGLTCVVDTDKTCVSGTKALDDNSSVCILDTDVACGDNTTPGLHKVFCQLNDSVDGVCGDGTRIDDVNNPTECVIDDTTVCKAPTSWNGTTCMFDIGNACNTANTKIDGNECKVDTDRACKPGTTVNNDTNTCKLDFNTACGFGTVKDTDTDNTCKVNISEACGPGTVEDGNGCKVDTDVVCVNNTEEASDGVSCKVDTREACGYGTVGYDDKSCIMDPWQQVGSGLKYCKPSVIDGEKGHRDTWVSDKENFYWRKKSDPVDRSFAFGFHVPDMTLDKCKTECVNNSQCNLIEFGKSGQKAGENVYKMCRLYRSCDVKDGKLHANFPDRETYYTLHTLDRSYLNDVSSP